MRQGRVRKILAWLPVLALLAGTLNHFWLVSRHQLSPWLGGGFGMFSTTDVGSARPVFITAVTRSGDERPVTLREPLREVMRHARALPDRERLAALAAATREAIGEEGSGLDSADLAALRIEVWRTRYDRDSLRPHLSRLAEKTFRSGDQDG